MISEQTAIHVPTSALRVRALADMAMAIEVTHEASTSVFDRVRCCCMAISNTSIRACQRALAAAWTRYVDAHTWTLANGITVWIDEYQTFVIDTPGTLDRGSISVYDQWLEAQVLGW